jgi:RHS repeat-associated protein
VRPAGLALRLRTIALAALFSFSTFAVQAAPSNIPLPRPEALKPQPAAALGCSSEPVFTGHITNNVGTTTPATETKTGNVVGYISDVVDDWSCTAYYRYDGLAWRRSDPTGVFDWGAIIHSTSVPCNWVIGETNFLKANDTTDCADSDGEYAMVIHFESGSSGTLLEGIYHADNTPDALGDFMFIHSDCTSYYESSGMSGERVRWGVEFGASEVLNRPGDNCDPTVIDGTGTGQTIVVDGSIPGSTATAATHSATRTVAVDWTAADDGPAGLESVRLYYATAAGGPYTLCQTITTSATSGSSTCTVPADGTFYLASSATDQNANAEPTPTASEDSVIVDTAAPTGALSIAAGATHATSATVTLNLTANGTGSAATEMRFNNDGGAWSSYEAFATARSNWSLTATDGTRTVFYQLTDAAGNESAPTAISDTIVLDRVDPAATIAIDGGAAVTTDTAVTLTLASSDATSGVASTEASNDNATFSAVSGSAPSWTLASGDGLKTVWFRVSDAAGRTTVVSDTITLTSDTDPPGAPSTPDLVAASDSGGSTTDDITSDATPTLVGTAEANSTVTLYDGGSSVATGSADGSGAWSITTSSLADGAHSFTAKATDAAQNTSPASSPLSVTVDTTAPSPPSTPDLVSASDSGASSADDVTSDVTPTLTGTAEANATVTVSADGVPVGNGSSVAGTWTITTATLSDGARSLIATATDIAGNGSAASIALSVTVDTAAPAAPSTPDLDAVSDTGSSSTDDLTNDPTPAFSGTAEANAAISLLEGATPLGTGTATAGAWNVTIDSHADGILPVTARATDLAGNVSATSAALTVTIDTAAPPTPSVPDLDGASDLGASPTDDVTSDPTPSVSGSAATADLVEIVDGAAVVGSVQASGGSYAVTLSTLTDGAHDLVARTRDAAGNTSTPSATLTISIDTAVPTATFVNPSGFATQPTHDVTVSWTESGTGSVVASRSMQRQAAPAMTGGTCAGLTFADDGDATTMTSPLEDAELVDTTCYRWAATLTDVAGNVGTVTSAAIQTSLSGTTIVRVRAAPASAVGAAAYIAAVIEDGAGASKPAYSGILTISSSDSGAVFPDGTTFHRKLADKDVGHTFRVLFSTPGTHQVTVSGPSATAGSTSVTVSAAALRAAAPATVYQNVPFKLAVIPRIGSKTSGAINKAYSARVTFSSSDANATFGEEVDGLDRYTFLCNCEGAHVFPTKLTALGTHTVTVTDQFGTTDTISVEVVAPSGSATGPITRVDTVQWPQGNTIDYYVTATGPYQLLGITDSCGLINRSLSASNAGLGSSIAGGAAITRLLADPASPVHDGVIPATALLEQRQYAEGTLRMTAETGMCGAGSFNEAEAPILTYADGAGHVFTVQSQKFRVFADIPGHANFVQQGADAPIASWTTASRGGTAAATFTDPNTGGSVKYVPGGLVMTFETRSPITIYRVEFLAGGGFLQTYNLGPGFSTYRVPAGTTTVAMNDVPYHNSCIQSESIPTGRVTYAGADGRTGVIQANWGDSTFPNPGSPSGWGCDGMQSAPEPPESNHPLRDAFDKLGLDDTLAMVDAVNSLSHMTMGDPVDVATGAQLGEATDFALGGRTPFLEFSRRYRSDVAEAVANSGTPAGRADGFLGVGWASNLDWRLELDLADDQIIVRGDGVGAVTYRQRDDGSWKGPRWLRMTLAPSGGDYLLTRPAGDGYRFDGDGRLLAVRDTQGHEMTLAYDANDRLDSFTDAAARVADVTTNGDGHVTRIDLPDGRYVAYTYTAGDFLSTVRMLDGETMTYVPDGRGRIKAIKDTLGRTVLSNTFDGRGRVIRQRDALDNPTSFTYDRPNLVTMTFGPRGDVTMTCLNPDGTTRATLDGLGGYRDYRRDDAGQPLAVIDELGQRTRYRYNAAGDLTEVVDAAGLSASATYDSKARITALEAPDATTVTSTFDATTGGPAVVTRADATHSLQIASYAYNALGLPEELHEPGGATTLLGYDSRGYVDSQTDAEGRETTFVTDGRGFVTSEIGPLGNAPGGVPANHTTTRTYDALGRRLTETYPADGTWTYTYDEMGRLLTTESPRGALTTNAYDVKGQLVSQTEKLTASLDAVTRFEYDAAGNLTAVTDPEDRRTEYDYDLLGRQISVTDPEDGVWQTTYDPLGRVVKETDPTGRSTETAYDAIGRVTATTDPAGETTTYAYDAAGRLETVTDPLDHETTYGYDWLGRQTSVTNAKDETASAVFDDAGDLVSVTNARSKTTTFDHDATHRLTLVTEPGSIDTVYSYDDGGRLETRTNDRGAIETYHYDPLGRLTELIDAAGESWLTDYDADGNIDSTTDGAGRTVDHAVDLGGRLLTLTPEVGAAITFAHDDSGLVTSMTDAAGTATYTYDDAGRLTSSARGGRMTSYAWDDAGRPASVTYPASGGTVEYAYDAAGRLDTITDWADRVTSYDYDDASRPTSITRPGDLVTTIGYDELDRPIDVDHVRSGTPILSQGYTYDANGNLATYTDDAGTATFGYDDLDRLTSAAFPGSQAYSYAYDAVGNLTSITTPSGNRTLAYDLADRITTSGYTYDDAGALTADPARTYAYDGFGRLTGATLGATTTTYTLDGAGNRLAETTGGSTTSFDLDLRSSTPTVLGDGTRKYLPGDPGAGYEQSGTWWSGLTDQVGSAHSYVSQAGIQSAVTRYDPFGGARPGSSVGSGLGFAAEWRDPAGLVNLRARAYDPSLGRFTSRDTFGGLGMAPQTANRYSYALNGPYRYADPSGRFVNALYANRFALVSLALAFNPVTAVPYGLLLAVTGVDPITGYRLSGAERFLAVLPALGKAYGAIARAGDGLAGAGRLTKAGRADDLAHLEVRSARGVDSAGAGSRFTRIDEIRGGAILQSTDASCVSACGAMLSGGVRSEAEILARIGENAGAEALARELGPAWRGGTAANLEARAFFDVLVAEGRPFGAIVRGSVGNHMVVVDGLDDLGRVMVRDPGSGSSFVTPWDEFMAGWLGVAVFKV